MTSSSGTNDVGPFCERRGLRAGGARPSARVDRDEPGQQRRDLDPGEVLLAGRRVDHDDREVEGQPGDVREGVSRVDRQRREHREDLLAEELVDALLLVGAELVEVHQGDALAGESRLDGVGEDPGMAGRQLVRPLGDALQHLPGAHARGSRDREAGGDAALEPGHPDHEELVEVGREDRQVPDALEQRLAGVLGELEHPLVEREPAELAVREAGLEGVVERVHRGQDVVRRLGDLAALGCRTGDGGDVGAGALRGPGAGERLVRHPAIVPPRPVARRGCRPTAQPNWTSTPARSNPTRV